MRSAFLFCGDDDTTKERPLKTLSLSLKKKGQTLFLFNYTVYEYSIFDINLSFVVSKSVVLCIDSRVVQLRDQERNPFFLGGG